MRRCRDCGGEIDELRNLRPICDECFDLRLTVVRAQREGGITPDEFAQVQKAFRSRGGSAAKRVRTVLGDFLADIDADRSN